MKELQILPENYSERVTPRIADIQVINGGVTILNISDPVFIDGATYYRIAGSQLEELTPEPRPADSIKLSECDGRHLITQTIKDKTVSTRLESELDGVYVFVARNTKGRVLGRLDMTAPIGSFIDIKVYDITK